MIQREAFSGILVPLLLHHFIDQKTRHLRLTLVLFSTPRYARENFMIADTQIPQGELVLAALGSVNHDDSKFVHPEQLILDRPDNKHLGFGSGMHYCLGEPLARLESNIAFQVLFERLPNIQLAVEFEHLR
jgi:cytochrome P450